MRLRQADVHAHHVAWAKRAAVGHESRLRHACSVMIPYAIAVRIPAHRRIQGRFTPRPAEAHMRSVAHRHGRRTRCVGRQHLHLDVPGAVPHTDVRTRAAIPLVRAHDRCVLTDAGKGTAVLPRPMHAGRRHVERMVHGAWKAVRGRSSCHVPPPILVHRHIRDRAQRARAGGAVGHPPRHGCRVFGIVVLWRRRSEAWRHSVRGAHILHRRGGRRRSLVSEAQVGPRRRCLDRNRQHHGGNELLHLPHGVDFGLDAVAGVYAGIHGGASCAPVPVPVPVSILLHDVGAQLARSAPS